jgi:hypothetical protein
VQIRFQVAKLEEKPCKKKIKDLPNWFLSAIPIRERDYPKV